MTLQSCYVQRRGRCEGVFGRRAGGAGVWMWDASLGRLGRGRCGGGPGRLCGERTSERRLWSDGKSCRTRGMSWWVP